MDRFFYFGACMSTAPRDILYQYWGFKEFRAKQEEVINSVLEGNDTLALMPTGGGKSLCFQVPSLAQEGICIVVSPLIALMKDQVSGLKEKGIKATAVYSGLSKREIDITLDNCIYGNFKFLYVSPERLETEIFRERLKQMHVNLLAVDEAHCISEWGYDFRPSYLKIAEIRELIPGVPTMALTATATQTVREDIYDKLSFQNGVTFQKSFERPNLVYGSILEEGKKSKLLETLDKVKGSGIVYVRTRKDTKIISQFLKQNNVSADYYHGGLDSKERTKKQDQWKKGQTRIIVATNAFGMGIDKPDVRSVLHLYLPDNLEAYYQEAGRAGRDGKRAFALCIINKADQLQLQERKENNFPTIQDIKNVYQSLGNFFQIPIGNGLNQSFDFNIKQFATRYNLPPLKAHNAIKILEQEGYIATTDAVFLPSRLMISLTYSDLYQFEVENPHYDKLLKTLLRSYEGVFDYYTPIDENELAGRIGVSVDELKNQLNKLVQYDVIDYLPQKAEPQLFFLQERLDTPQLALNEKQLRRRKAIFEEKLEWVSFYAFEENTCRTQLLLRYFGEHSEEKCGHCDLCLKEKREKQQKDQFRKVKERVFELLATQPMDTKSLQKAMPAYDENKVLEVIRWLYDKGSLQMEGNELTVSNHSETQ